MEVNTLVRVRINNLDIKDYIRMSLNGLPTSVKWNEVKDMVMSNGYTFRENCIKYEQKSFEVLHDEPSKETLRAISKSFDYGIK